MIGGVTIGSALLRAPSSIFKITAPKPIPTPIGVAHGLQIREIGLAAVFFYSLFTSTIFI